jgi:hypothetical protein
MGSFHSTQTEVTSMDWVSLVETAYDTVGLQNKINDMAAQINLMQKHEINNLEDELRAN